MPSTGRVLGRTEATEDFSIDQTNYLLTTRLEVLTATGSNRRILESTLWYEARFSLRAEGESRGKNVGHLYAWKVDKTIVQNGAALWLTELLASEDEETYELTTMLQELYRPNGQVRPQVKARKTELGGDQVLFVDTLRLKEEVRGTGLSRVVMQAFHRLLPYVSNSFDYSGTIVLSPAASGDSRSGSTKSDVEVESVLMRMYAGVGYEVYVRGEEDVEGSVTVMGLVIAAGDEDEDGE